MEGASYMASDISSGVSGGRGDARRTRESQAEEAREVQDDFKSQKASLQSNHEAELRRIRNNNRRVEVEMRDAGEAAVIQIKSTSEDRVENVKSNERNRIHSTAEQSAKEYAELKNRARATRESTKAEIEQERTRSKETIGQVRDNQMKTIEESQSKLKDLVMKQQEAHQQLQQKSRAEFQNTQSRSNKVLDETKVENRARLQAEQESGRTAVAQTKTQTTEQLEATRRQGSETLVQMRHEQQKQLEGERLSANRTVGQMRDKNHASIDQMRIDGEKRRNSLDSSQAEQLQKSRERFLETNEKVQKEYSNETQRVQSEGEAEIDSRKTGIRVDLKKQDEEYKTEKKTREEAAFKAEKRAHVELREKISERERLHEATLKEQQGDFETRRTRNDVTHKDSLGNQRNKYSQALYQQQREFDGKFSKVSDRKDDPFYSLQSFDARLEDNADHYVVRAQVPAHERDHVDIRVKDGKVALSASRQMEEKRNDEGVKVASSAYQTWRQEIPLKMPIYREGVTKSIDPDGSIVVKIPKKI